MKEGVHLQLGTLHWTMSYEWEKPNVFHTLKALNETFLPLITLTSILWQESAHSHLFSEPIENPWGIRKGDLTSMAFYHCHCSLQCEWANSVHNPHRNRIQYRLFY